MLGTDKVYVHSFVTPCGTYKVNLLDTPGFDDTYKSDPDVLIEISGYLSRQYESRILLKGILYLHRISDNRMGGSARKNLNLFRKLVGRSSLRNVIFTTTMWDLVTPDNLALHMRRESDLKTNDEFWGTMIRHGARMSRHDGSPASALGLVYQLCGVYRKPVPLSIQQEIVDRGTPLHKTLAGQYLKEDLKSKEEEYERKLEEVERCYEEARKELGNSGYDKEYVDTLKSYSKELKAKLNNVKEEKEKLKEAHNNDRWKSFCIGAACATVTLLVMGVRFVVSGPSATLSGVLADAGSYGELVAQVAPAIAAFASSL